MNTKDDMSMKNILVKKLYVIGMLGAVMELDGSRKTENGASYETKIGEYKLISFYGSISPEEDEINHTEVNVVSVSLSKDEKDCGSVYLYKKVLTSEKYAQLFSSPDDGQNYELREEFIGEMFVESKCEGIRIMPSDKEYGLLDSDKRDLRIQILKKCLEVQGKYTDKKSARNR